MTVTTATRRVVFTGNGATTEFDYSFRIYQASHVVVKTYEIATNTFTTLTDSQYEITGIGYTDIGGTVTYPLTGSPLAATHKIYIERVVPYTQEQAISNQAGYRPETVERSLDLLTMQIQQTAEGYENRALRIPTTELSIPEIPFSASRANKLLGFDADGNILLYNEASVGAGSITTSELQDGAVTAAKLAATAITDKLGYTPADVDDLAGKSPTITDQTAVGTLASGDEFLVWDVSAAAFRKVTATEIVAPTAALPVSPYVKFGCLPENIDGNTERFFKGLLTAPGGSPSTAYSLGGAAAYLEVYLPVTGAGGRDTGTLASFNNKTAYFYLLINDTDPLQNKMIASLALSAGSVVRPSGYTANTPIRLPYAKIYRTTGGFQPHHMKGGQPWSVHLTGWDTVGTWNITGSDNTAGTGSYTDADVSLWVPNNARLVRFRIKATGTSAPGVVYVSSPGISDEKLVASVNATGHVDVGEFEVRVSSLSVFQVKATSGVTHSMVPVEYTMSDDC